MSQDDTSPDPTNPDREEQIRARAHALWEAEGKPHGKDALHWDQAARELSEPEIQNDETFTDLAEEQADAAIEVVESAKAAVARKSTRKKP